MREKFSRKDYEKVAQILKGSVDDPSLRAMLALEFAVWFLEDNSRFNGGKFFRATKRKTGRKVYYPITNQTIVD